MTAPVQPRNTSAFYAQAAISFGIATLATGVGIAYLPLGGWTRGFLALGFLYAITSAFTLAKVIRDNQEASTVINRVDQARLERFLAEHDIFRPGTSTGGEFRG